MDDRQDYNIPGILECIRSVVDDDSESALQIKSDSPLADYLDSFRLVQLVVALEDKFGIGFTQAELLNGVYWTTAVSVSALIATKKPGKRAA